MTVIGKFSLLLQEVLPAGLKDVGREQVHRELWQGLRWILFSKRERVDHVSHNAFGEDKLSVRYINGASCVQRILEVRANKKFLQAQAIYQCSPFEIQLYLRALMFLKDCMHKELIMNMHNYHSGMPVAYEVQLVFIF